MVGQGLSPKGVRDVGVKLWSGNGDLAASVVDDALVGCPENKLLATFGDRDADEIAEEHPVVSTVMLTDYM